MSRYVLLAESGADLPAALAEKYGVWIVPMHVSFGDETRDDGSFPVRDIYEYFERTGNLTKTSGCTPDDFERIFDAIQSRHPDSHILHLAYSAVTTCSYQSARIAAEGRKNITSIDTKHVTAGQSLVVILLARYLEAHPDCPLEEAVRVAEDLSRRCRMGFFPGDLAYLRAGGRVSNAAYLGAKILSLHPLIELRDGHLNATKKYRGKMDRVAIRLLRDFAAQYRLERDILAFVYSAGLAESIHAEADEAAKQLGFREVLWVQTGGVVTTHCGPGGFGVCGLSSAPGEVGLK